MLIMSERKEISEPSDESPHSIIIDAYKQTLLRPQLLYKYLVEQGHSNISLKKVKETLNQYENYQMHKSMKKIKTFRKTFSPEKFYIVQADLMHNTQYPQLGNYLIVIIDVLTRFAWVTMTDRKVGRSVSAALSHYFDLVESEFKYKVHKFICDRGSEFYNKDLLALFKKRGIEIFSTHSPFKASMVERFIRTLRMKLEKRNEVLMSEKKTLTLNHLSEVVNEYNNTYHTGIKMKPIEAFEASTEQLLEQYKPKKPLVKADLLEPNTFVRVAITKKPFIKESKPKWSKEIFMIKGRLTDGFAIYYKIADLNDNLKPGSYYREQLLPIESA